jgi:hypothetical protein
VRKYLILCGITVFALVLAIGSYYLLNSECYACTDNDCLDNGSVTYAGRLFDPSCGYVLRVTGKTGCPSGAPYAWFQDTDCFPPQGASSVMMGVSDIRDLCTDYSIGLPLLSGHTYTIWFECGYGYDGDYIVAPDCYE